MTAPFPAERVCIVLLTGVGDVVHGLPVVNALKRRHPACRITWIAEPAPSWVVRPHPAVDEVVVFERARGLAGVRELWRSLRGRRFDLTLNLNVYFKSVFPTVFSGAPRRLGFGRGRAREGVWLFSNQHLPPGPRRHTQDLFLEFLDALGVERGPLEWRITLAEEERRAQAEFFQRLDGLEGRPAAALIPASAKAAKDWLPERYAAVADALEADYGFRVLLLGGASPREARLAREVLGHCRTRPIWALGDGVRRLITLIAGSRLVIAPDTGPVHLARALEVPVIGLYGHTNPWRVGPYRKYQDLWVDRYTEEGEAPEPGGFEPKSGRMQQITVAEVLDRVERAVSR
ncbi:MAG: glycosyltransferase family 9 protein [Gemmatimonadetes bacterium]|nr:glycosyltransferase family 9 protein [Gemmatimonadota bacterium]